MKKAANDTASGEAEPPRFDRAFRDMLEELLRWRRDVRRFRTDPVPEETMEEILRLAILSPSVGNAQPWRFVLVEDDARRAEIVANFEYANADAAKIYDDETAATYASLKLAGLKEAPVHLAVFCDDGTLDGRGLGRQTMPETLAYSVVGAITTLWLAARAYGVGLGWVSILDADAAAKTLEVPEIWSLIGYLCMGYPVEAHTDPELVRAGWQQRIGLDDVLLKR
jgi:5,6-dimethylbenzimidazole synthase